MLTCEKKNRCNFPGMINYTSTRLDNTQMHDSGPFNVKANDFSKCSFKTDIIHGNEQN